MAFCFFVASHDASACAKHFNPLIRELTEQLRATIPSFTDFNPDRFADRDTGAKPIFTKTLGEGFFSQGRAYFLRFIALLDLPSELQKHANQIVEMWIHDMLGDNAGQITEARWATDNIRIVAMLYRIALIWNMHYATHDPTRLIALQTYDLHTKAGITHMLTQMRIDEKLQQSVHKILVLVPPSPVLLDTARFASRDTGGLMVFAKFFGIRGFRTNPKAFFLHVVETLDMSDDAKVVAKKQIASLIYDNMQFYIFNNNYSNRKREVYGILYQTIREILMIWNTDQGAIHSDRMIDLGNNNLVDAKDMEAALQKLVFVIPILHNYLKNHALPEIPFHPEHIFGFSRGTLDLLVKSMGDSNGVDLDAKAWFLKWLALLGLPENDTLTARNYISTAIQRNTIKHACYYQHPHLKHKAQQLFFTGMLEVIRAWNTSHTLGTVNHIDVSQMDLGTTEGMHTLISTMELHRRWAQKNPVLLTLSPTWSVPYDDALFRDRAKGGLFALRSSIGYTKEHWLRFIQGLSIPRAAKAQMTDATKDLPQKLVNAFYRDYDIALRKNILRTIYQWIAIWNQRHLDNPDHIIDVRSTDIQTVEGMEDALYTMKKNSIDSFVDFETYVSNLPFESRVFAAPQSGGMRELFSLWNTFLPLEADNYLPQGSNVLGFFVALIHTLDMPLRHKRRATEWVHTVIDLEQAGYIATQLEHPSASAHRRAVFAAFVGIVLEWNAAHQNDATLTINLKTEDPLKLYGMQHILETMKLRNKKLTPPTLRTDRQMLVVFRQQTLPIFASLEKSESGHATALFVPHETRNYLIRFIRRTKLPLAAMQEAIQAILHVYPNDGYLAWYKKSLPATERLYDAIAEILRIWQGYQATPSQPLPKITDAHGMYQMLRDMGETPYQRP